jgi:hypothetical protein
MDIRIPAAFSLLIVMLTQFIANRAYPADWFVAPDAGAGDGSRVRPFHDPYVALRIAEPGDTIHIAAGTYYGRYERSYWEVDRPRITILGGYNHDFSQRAPWRTPSIFAVYRGYEFTRDSSLLVGRGDHTSLVLDGLVFDAAGRNTYGGSPNGLSAISPVDGAIVSLTSPDVTIRNSVFVNSATGGIELAGEGSRFENNLVINMLGTGMLTLRDPSRHNGQPFVVRSNTFAFAHDSSGPPLGRGADNGICIRVSASAIIENNAFISCANAAIALLGADQGRVNVDRNLFHMIPHDIVARKNGADVADIDEQTLDELADLGLKSAADNNIQDPQLTGLRLTWVDAFSRHMLRNYAHPPREAVFALRVASALYPDPATPPSAPPNADSTTKPETSSATDASKPKEESKGALAPALDVIDALALRVETKQGAHPVAFSSEPQSPALPASSHTYQAIDWPTLLGADASLSGQRIEVRAGLGNQRNQMLFADLTQSTHTGFPLFRPGSEDFGYQVYTKRDTLGQRQFEEALKSFSAREIEDTYLVRGIYRGGATGAQKSTLIVESMVPAPTLAPQIAQHRAGRDWFVRAGASGGDGSWDKPFRDPFQALEKAEGGDTIHVTTGEYFGKLHSGKWKISVRNLTLLGGYDVDFATRDPWKNPTRFLLSEQEKAKRNHDGTFLNSDDPVDGLILDGFIFDGASLNTYASTGSLDVQASPRSALIDLRAGRDTIIVRNSVFLNASGAAASISAPAGAFTNNIVINTSGFAVVLAANGAGPWIVRNNAILFAADPSNRASTGASTSGTLLNLRGRGIVMVESNILALGDNCGLRATIPAQKLSLNRNVFASNLYCHYTDAHYIFTNTVNFERRAVLDSGLASVKGNAFQLPRLPLDRAFADAALTRLFTLPSHVSADEWKSIVVATGSGVQPIAAAETPAVPTPRIAASPSKERSLENLVADLGRLKSEVSGPSITSSGSLYCPAYDWRKALDLARTTPTSDPGVHKFQIAIAFVRPQQSQPDVQYTRVTETLIDANHTMFDNQRIEMDVSDIRSTVADALFIPGFSRNDYDAYIVSQFVGSNQRTVTAISVLIRRDTAAGKLLDHSTPSDIIRLRGTGRINPKYSGLVVIVDSAALLDH